MPERREARRFEPPPWEADQFAELERAQLESEQRAAATRDAAPQQAAVVGSTPTIGQAVAEAVVQQAQATSAGASPDAVGAGAGVAGEPNEAAVQAMLAQLSAEEPKTHRQFWKASVAFAIVLVLIGIVLAVWGGAAIATAGKSGRLGATGGAALSSLGSLFVGAGGWVIFSNLRKRGVL